MIMHKYTKITRHVSFINERSSNSRKETKDVQPRMEFNQRIHFHSPNFLYYCEVGKKGTRDLRNH